MEARDGTFVSYKELVASKRGDAPRKPVSPDEAFHQEFGRSGDALRAEFAKLEREVSIAKQLDAAG
jgi:hypothetical protein